MLTLSREKRLINWREKRLINWTTYNRIPPRDWRRMAESIENSLYWSADTLEAYLDINTLNWRLFSLNKEKRVWQSDKDIPQRREMIIFMYVVLFIIFHFSYGLKLK